MSSIQTIIQLPNPDLLQLTRQDAYYTELEEIIVERSLPFVWPTGTIIFRPLRTVEQDTIQ